RAGRPRTQPSRGVDRRWLLAGGGVAIVVAAILVVLSLSGGGDGGDGSAAAGLEGLAESEALLAGIGQDGTSLGDPGAPVTLVEYADLQCPFCARWSAATFPTIVEEYVRPGRVRMEFRGLAFLGPDSERGLRAAVAAGEQGRLWNVVEVLFRNQGAENSGWLDEDLLGAVAAGIDGLDGDAMLAASDSEAVTSAILGAAGQASDAGVAGTPSFAAGKTGGSIVLLDVRSLDPDGIRGALDALLAGS
ncbi:MAG: DsbA family protein, partial [Gaiellales bacterium]